MDMSSISETYRCAGLSKQQPFYLRGRFLLTVICCPIYHCWRSVVKWIYHECVVRVIYSMTTDRQPVIYWAKKQDSISILTHKKLRKGKCILQVFPVFPPLHIRNPAEN